MPRKARIDGPGAVHHIIIRGIERRRIFKDDLNRGTHGDRPEIMKFHIFFELVK
jgi:putative transposase